MVQRSMISSWVLHSVVSLEINETIADEEKLKRNFRIEGAKEVNSGFLREGKQSEFEKSGKRKIEMNKKKGIYRRLVRRSIGLILKFEIAQLERLRAMICFRESR